MLIKITNRDTLSVSFSHYASGNTIKLTVEMAIKSKADLRGSDLFGANLRGADLRGADLRGSDLRSANLYGADLRGSNLGGADLYGSDLYGANLRGADLRGALNAELPIARTRILPEGDLIGWKKCKGDIIVKLQIPEQAKRSHAFGRKCRAEFVNVLEVVGADIATSCHDGKTKYERVHRVSCDVWEEDYTKECSGGIHFYITRIEAEND